MRLGRYLAVQPLLQAVEGERAEIMTDKQFTVENGVPVKCDGQVRKGGGDIIAGSRENAPALAIEYKLYADAIPFPFGLIIAGDKPVEITRLVDWVRQHHRMEDAPGLDMGCRGATIEPGEQIGIGGGQAVPDFLDLCQILSAIGRQRGLRQPRRHADTKPACCKLDHCPALGRAGAVKKGGKMGGDIRFRARLDTGDEIGDAGKMFTTMSFRRVGPDQ